MSPSTQAEVHVRLLRLAARKLGGQRELRAFLQVPGGQLLRWLTGFEPLPEEISMRLISLLVQDAAQADGAAPVPLP